MTALETARLYFDLSNASDFAGIGKMLHAGTSYRSGNGDLFLGAEDILAMQREYHGSFARLHWTVDRAEEIGPGIARLEFSFKGESAGGEPVSYRGIEHVLARDGRIEHIDVERVADDR